MLSQVPTAAPSDAPVTGPVLLVGLPDDDAEQVVAALAAQGVAAQPLPGRAALDVGPAVARSRARAVVWRLLDDVTGADEVQALALMLQGDTATAGLPILVVRGDGTLMVDEVVNAVLVQTVRTVTDLRVVHHDDVRVLEADEFRTVLGRQGLSAGRHGGRQRARTAGSGAVAVIDVHERATIRDRFGAGGLDIALTAVAAHARDGAGSLEVLGADPSGALVLLIPDRSTTWVEHRLRTIAAAVGDHEVVVADDRLHLTPVIGWAPLSEDDDPALVHRRAGTAAAVAAEHLDLRPVRWLESFGAPVAPDAGRRGAVRRLLRTSGYIAVTLLLGVVAPFVVLVWSQALGYPVAAALHVVVAVALVVTAASIWLEGVLSLRDPAPPPARRPAPPATAIVAAYLPNEAATIVESLRAFQAVDYPDLQIVLAYNTPRPLPVEDTLRQLAEADPRIVLLPVAGSTSKAQNVNAALAVADGEFVGVFDADHHPDPGSFARAWQWLGSGYDVVQGRCAVRNGDASLVARTVAVEFEGIYGVSHPGRARLHGFGIFGGSNGYWRTSVLRATRFRGSMLTEDIDASVRLLARGGLIACDPGLRSNELAPTTVRHLWRQRLRWAQGWFQVTRSHSSDVWSTFDLSRRQKLGMTFLLRWRELIPWLSQLVLPLFVYEAWRAGGDVRAMWFDGVFLLTALLTFSTTPGQAVFAWVRATPQLRRHPWWFVGFLVAGMVCYTEFRNLVARVAQVQELFREHDWVVTPRTSETAGELEPVRAA